MHMHKFRIVYTMKPLCLLLASLSISCWGFAPLSHRLGLRLNPLLMSSASDITTSADEPQVWSSGYSPKGDFLEAIQDATEIAMAGLPKGGAKIDLAIVSVSSLYDGQASPSVLVPAVLSTASTYGAGIQNLVGCTTGGIISSVRNEEYGMVGEGKSACVGIESEGTPGVSVVLGILPDVQLKVSVVGMLHVCAVCSF